MYLDKIVELAPRWLSKTCDSVDNDSNNEDEEEEEQQQNGTEKNVTSTGDSNLSSYIRSSATGASIDTENIEVASSKTRRTIRSLVPSNARTGTFSSLLIAAFEQLVNKFELCKTSTGIYVTKLEQRTATQQRFLIRKIYITPSNILYEGPYHEEKCAVTRQFAEYQDRFIRVAFRDEGKPFTLSMKICI